jgi:tRNA1Val (adenine37-N6)-methyltransferase
MKKTPEKMPFVRRGEPAARNTRQRAGDDDALTIPDETVDTLFDGKLRFYQSRTGYRFSLDAVLLAYFARPRRGAAVADLGSGNGVIALMLAYLHPSLDITGIEIQSGLADRAARNVRLNRLERVKIIPGDVRAIETLAEPASYAVVVCNPPYRKPGSGRVSPDEERKIARHETKGNLADFLRAGAYLLPAKGRIALVYLAAGLAELLLGMRHVAIEPKRLRMIHSYAGMEASLVLVEGVKGGRGGLKVLPPLVVYAQGKKYTAEVAAMLAGKPATPIYSD